MAPPAFVSASPNAWVPRSPLAPRRSVCAPNNRAVRMDAAADSSQPPKLSKRQIRRRLTRRDSFHRNGFKEMRPVVQEYMDDHYNSSLMAELKKNDYVMQTGQITWKMAKAYGFCWGVERAVSQAFEAAAKFPDKNIYLTNEIIHNPTVNEQMKEKGIRFVSEFEDGKKDYSALTKDDVVVLPAFGVTHDDLVYLSDHTHAIVDTTCPWVSAVWKQVDDHQVKNVTSIVHGKYKHEETIATVSFGDKYLVVLNYAEAEYVCDYILNGGDRDEFMAKFDGAMSRGFDPDTDLRAVGVANQTTMLKTETTEIAKLFERTMMKLHDPQTFQKSFVAADTICDATQERQDALTELLQQDLDLMLVIGGFNSSNTSHLQEMAELKGVTSYWIDTAQRILPGNKIWARTAHGEERLVEDFLPRRPITIGVTSGASSPDKSVEDAMSQINLTHSLLLTEERASV